MPKLSQEFEEYLAANYPTGDKDEICAFMNKNWHAIGELARRRKIKRLADPRRKGTLEPLFNKTLESFYWLGFIMTDGYVSKDGHLMISQSEKDKSNIERLSEFLKTKPYVYDRVSGYGSTKKTYRVNICDKRLGPKIYELFGIPKGSKKTESVISTDFIENEDQALALLCGIIEGDGSKAWKGYRIQCHKSQDQTFIGLMTKLSSISLAVKLVFRKDRGEYYCNVAIGSEDGEKLREFARKNKLPVSERKF